MNGFYRSILTCALLTAGSSFVAAQTRTVSKTLPADHATVQAAIGFFAGDTNPTPNVIQILDADSYDEIITIDVPVTLEGTALAAPTLLLQANSNGRAGSSGLVINLPNTVTTGAVTLKNLNLIPSLSSTPNSGALNVVNNNVYVSLEKVLITGNDGFGLPITTTGLVNVPADTNNHRHFGDNGIYAGNTDNSEFEGEGLEIQLKNTIISHLRGTATGTSYGIFIPPSTAPNRMLRILDGCVISFNNGKGLQIDGDFDLNAPNQRMMVVGNAQIALHFSGESPNIRRVKGAIIAGNSQVGLYESTNSGFRSTVEDSIIASNTTQGSRIAGTATTPLTFIRSTLGRSTGAAYEPLRLDGGVASDVVFDNSIIVGNGAFNAGNRITNLGTGTYRFKNSALVMGGSQYINYPLSDMSKLVEFPSVYTNPQFTDVTDFTSPGFFQVQSGSYANLGSSGTPLDGGGTYSGPAAPAAPQDVTVTVAKSGGNFTTVQAALSSLVLDNTKRYTVQILDGAVYDEVITMNVPATIIGTGSSRPVLAVQPNSAGFDNDGAGATHETLWSGNAGLFIDIPVSVTTCTVGLKNLIIIPSKSTSEDAAAGIVNKANNFYLDLENVLVTANDGNDAPVSTDGRSLVASDPAHRHFKVSGAHIGSITNDRPEGDGVEVNMSNCIFTHIRGAEGGSWRSGFYLFRTFYVTPVAPAAGTPLRPGAFRHLTVDSQSVFTYNLGSGLRCSGSLIIDTPTAPSYFVGNGPLGTVYNGCPALSLDMQKGFNMINGVVVSGNTNLGINESVGNSGPRVYLNNAIIADNRSYGLYHRLGTPAQSPSNVRNTTVVNNSLGFVHKQMQVSGTGTNIVPVDSFDTIYAGNGLLSNAGNNLDINTAGRLRINTTAISVAGPFALRNPAVVFTGTNTANLILEGTPVSEADPQFINITDPFAPAYYAVTNPEFATLASGGTPLRGGSVFVPSSSVASWSLY